MAFERIWNNPRKYLPMLKKFEGVICPDFSLYRDMPLVMQLWNIYRSRAIGSWLQQNDIKVIANVRFSDPRTYTSACLGVPIGGTIAVGSHGCIKCLADRVEFVNGLNYVVKVLKPQIIVVFGTAPNYIFDDIKNMSIEILNFPNESYRGKRKENL